MTTWYPFPGDAPKHKNILIRGVWVKSWGPPTDIGKEIVIIATKTTMLSRPVEDDELVWMTDNFTTLDSYPFVEWTHWAEIPSLNV